MKVGLKEISGDWVCCAASFAKYGFLVCVRLSFFPKVRAPHFVSCVELPRSVCHVLTSSVFIGVVIMQGRMQRVFFFPNDRNITLWSVWSAAQWNKRWSITWNDSRFLHRHIPQHYCRMTLHSAELASTRCTAIVFAMSAASCAQAFTVTPAMYFTCLWPTGRIRIDGASLAVALTWVDSWTRVFYTPPQSHLLPVCDSLLSDYLHGGKRLFVPWPQQALQELPQSHEKVGGRLHQEIQGWEAALPAGEPLSLWLQTSNCTSIFLKYSEPFFFLFLSDPVLHWASPACPP